jgi:hypothetical protein
MVLAALTLSPTKGRRCNVGMSAIKGKHAMDDKTFGLDSKDEDLLITAISDEALEIAAGTVKEMASYTLGACSGFSVCPA